MGNDQINLKKARILNNAEYAESIDVFSEKYCSSSSLFERKIAKDEKLFKNSGIHVCVRKRPLWEKEKEIGEFDTITVGGSLSHLDEVQRDTMWLHNPKLRLDCKNRYVDHHGFPFDAVFDEKDDNAKVYATTLAPLVATAQQPGGRASVIAFGQTGSGKTYTMTHLSELAATDLFATLPTECTQVELTAIEVQGTTVRDLLAEKVQRIKLLQDADKNLVMKGVVPHLASNAKELCSLLGKAYEKRVTEATGVNDTSSRSHAIYRISCMFPENTEGENKEAEENKDDDDDFNYNTAEEDAAAQAAADVARIKRTKELKGTLTLVDLAGSEWSRDQKDHNRKQQAQSRDINASLMTLKQCIRARVTKDVAAAAGKKIPNNPMPIRGSKLTRVLQDCFVDADACTVVIACVSPTSGDVEHTMESLRGGQGDMNKGSGWGMPPETLLSSNIPGVAVLGEKDRSLAEAAVADAAVKSSSTTRDFEKLHPLDWTPSDICVWWTVQASIAFHAAVQESQKTPSTFTITINASDAIEDTVCKLGMKFQREPTNKAPRVNDINPKGLVGRAIQLRQKSSLASGCVLVGIDGETFDGSSSIKDQRKTILAAVKPKAIELGKAAAEWQSWSREGNTSASKPKDVSVVLTFETASLVCPRMPVPIPNIFTGASRLGTADGRQLVNDFGCVKFASSVFEQMGSTGGSNSFLGKMMWTDLRRLMKEMVPLENEKKEGKKEEMLVQFYDTPKKSKQKPKKIIGQANEQAENVKLESNTNTKTEKDIPAYQKVDILYE